MGIFGGNQPGQPRYTGALHNLSLTESVFGTVLPIVIGTTRVHGKLLDYNGFNAQNAPSGGKGIFGGKGDIYDYFANVVIALAQGPCAAILNVWDQQGKLQNQSSTYTYTVPTGGGSVAPSPGPRIQQDLGVTAQQSYSVVANDYGSSGPVTYAGTQRVPLTSVPGTPGAGQYNFNSSTGTYTFPAAAAGQVLTLSYSCVFSLYYFAQTQAAEIPISSPWQISADNQAYFWQDNGVVYVDTGAALTKVGGTPSTGQYSESDGVYTFASADAGRYVYINYTYTSSDPDLTNQSSLNLTFFNGAQSQEPWGFLVSNYPSSAFGYSAICYVGAAPMAMGESPTLPSYNYEIVGLWTAPAQLDADATVAITGILTNPLCGINFPTGSIGDLSAAKAYWGANGFFISECLTSQMSASNVIERWLEAGNVGAVWSAGQLKLIPYGDRTCVGNGYTYSPNTTPAATLTWDNLLPFTDKKTGETTNDDPIQVERTAAKDAYNYMQVEWTNRLNDYNNELTPEQNDAFIAKYGLRMEGSQSWHFITTQATATWALNLRLKRALYKRNTYKFNLPFTFSALEPMDVVVLPTGEPVRITEVEDDPAGKLSFTAEQFAWGSGSATITPKQTPSSYQPQNSQAIPGNTSAYIFEATPQSVLAQPNTVQIAAAGNQPAWGGCDIYVSQDGTTYTKIGRWLSTNRAGLLSGALPATADPDTTDVLPVDMTLSGGELSSATDAEANNFVTLCAICDASGTLELISYGTAALTAPNRYNLTYLRRGVYGTPVLAHAIGAEFAYLGTSGVFEYQYPGQFVGQTLSFKFPAFNLLQGQLQSLSQCQAVTFKVPGTTLQPPSSGGLVTVPTSPLSAIATSTTQGYVLCAPFIAKLNGQSASCLPAGTWMSASVTPGQSFYVYYVDPAFVGGAITPVLTQNLNDFQAKSGYYFIGIVTVPYYSSGGSTIWSPSSYQDTGTMSTVDPAAAYSQNPSEHATVQGQSQYIGGSVYSTTGICTWTGFPNTTPTGDTVEVNYAVAVNGTGNSGSIRASFDGGNTFTSFATFTANVTQTTATISVPSGTDLDQIQVEVTAGSSTAAPGDYIYVSIYSITVQ